MQVSIGANCWDGAHRKQLFEAKRNFAAGSLGKTDQRRWERAAIKSAMSYSIPFGIMATGFIQFGSTASAHTLREPVDVAAMAVPSVVKEKILHAFDPLIDLAIALSYPIAGVMIAGGCLFVMIGNREKGMQMLQNAAIGYILVQLSPMFLNLLVGVGGTVS
jgi:hypothetical protein